MIRIDKNNAVKWLLSGIAFAAVIGAASGCGSGKSAMSAARDGDFETLPSASTGTVDTHSTVNTFGDINGVESAPPTGGVANFQQVTALADGSDSDVAVDPTGKFIAFASTRHGDHAEIYMQRVGGQS